ncbi:23S rRNA (adenine(2030)-N(6))-methyltransferase RlmJ [Halomonas vilamensis]|uniref:Ribosomal RNA large subunit methyltransferase J n=1 Tax=Vreelandella vilamensis TaxID=531309 RepID=A0ABU1H3L9_9GAMM|nr:23S rRNA (adenine(2030)-N(6))-methyltransferase RlmJ [Halomonas vilamensis]MDR5898901.1 23S rRNA (adenine(2030)-N(6))-methyltransferase RlmJ [Halomonas vilamensis]
MLSYQHAYHAGNFADVHKHVTLFAVVDYLLRKKSPITYIDTHAGRGVYPLAAKESQRLQEYREGVDKLWQAKHTLNDPLLRQWCDALASLQPSPAALTHYPGSPWWLHQRLRQQDALQLFELHPGEHRHLEDQALSANAMRTYGDGLAGLGQRLPVSTPRLSVLIDPSYERKQEYQEVVEAVIQAMKKARHAIVMIWYPLLPAGHHHILLEGLAASGIRNIWRSELCLRSPSEQRHGMYGSGMVVINPPWGLDERLNAAMREVTALLGAASHYRDEWLVGE